MRQAQALTVMMSGANVFLTGAPGAGKTYVLQQFIKKAQAAGRQVAVTASTGIAASHLGGTTIHSWSGLGILDVLTNADVERLGGNDRLIKRYNTTDVLVIDEISMLHGFRLDMINELAKVLRANDKPFGGMQVILVGDLFQLPPVSRYSQSQDFAHRSQSWQELELQICYLTEQHRQASHDSLLELLQAMRQNTVQDFHLTLLQERVGQQSADEQPVTRLFSHNMDVDSINTRHLADLDTEQRTFTMLTKGSKAKVEQLKKGLLVPEALPLKVGAEIMFVANNFAEGFVNGTRGQVIDFENSLPLVRLQSGKVVNVEYHTWSLNEDGKVRAEVSQLPLRLAWAITIHKSQGMSLDAAYVDLSRAFTPGMGYVALSRIRSLKGLYLQGINQMALGMHPEIHSFDATIQTLSQQLADDTEDYEEPEAPEPEADIAKYDEALFDELKRWRFARAKQDGVAPFMIAHNTALEALASRKPANEQQLLAVPGFGPRKVELYSGDILSIIVKN